MSDKRPGRAPALFDDAAFAEDLRRASDGGQEVALAARSRRSTAAPSTAKNLRTSQPKESTSLPASPSGRAGSSPPKKRRV